MNYSLTFVRYPQLQLAQMSADMSRDELHGLSVSGGESSSGGGASPLTARSIRLERFAQALANSQEELRRWVIFFKNVYEPRIMKFFEYLMAFGTSVCLTQIIFHKS